MKRICLLLSATLIFSHISVAAEKYFVGPRNGLWSDAANWSLRPGGVGGAGAPSLRDDIWFVGLLMIKMDVSPIVRSISTEAGHTDVTLIATSPITITILNRLSIGPQTIMTDSTTANVPFNVYFKTGATAGIWGDWVFRGSVPVSGNNGAFFTAPSGTFVRVAGLFGYSPVSGSIIQGKNARPLVSSASTLSFDNKGTFVADSVKDVVIPDALWAKDSLVYEGSSRITEGCSNIRILQSFSSIRYAGTLRDFGSMFIDLPRQTSDVDLGLTDGTKFSGVFKVTNTNYFRLTLLAPTSATSSVTVEMGTTALDRYLPTFFEVSGAATRVSLARASALAPATSYKLLVERDFIQTGGNFSLQDYDLATGSSTLDLKGNFTETGGTFYTNSTSTSATAEFRVIMDDPRYFTGPSGDFQSSRTMTVSSGTIDNGRQMVILRIDHTCYSIPGSSAANLNGVILRSPLTVGKLELLRSPLTTTAASMLTVLNPAANAVFVGASNSYVNGPMRRVTNSTGEYTFPLGQGNTAAYGYYPGTLKITPAATTTSLYMGEFVNSGFGSYAVTAPLEGVSTNKYYNVTRYYGADATLMLYFRGAITGSTASKGIVVAGRSSGGTWIKKNGTIYTPGTASMGAVTTERLSNFRYFTFGYGDRTALSATTKASMMGWLENSSSTATLLPDESTSASVYPNPFKDNFTIDFYAGAAFSKGSVNVYNSAGALVYTKPINQISVGKNRTNINLPAKDFPGNMYVVRLYVDGMENQTIKLLRK